MSRLPVAIALAALLAAAAPAQAGRLSRAPAELHALAVGPDGRALAVVDSGRPGAAFRLVASDGRRRRALGVFGGADGEFPDIASSARRTFVSWARPVSGGSLLSTARVSPAGRIRAARQAALSTGPGRLTVHGGRELLAFPDEAGDVALHPPARRGADGAYDVPRRSRLTRDAPAVRHLPLDVAAPAGGPLVLDLAQRRGRSSLLVLGSGAPRRPLLSIPAVRHVEARMAVGPRLVAVAYLSRGRAVLATARPGGSWRRWLLPGTGGGIDAPAAVVAGRRVHVLYNQGVTADRDLYLATVSGGRVRGRRLTRGPADDRHPHAAARGGRLYAGWTREARGSSRSVPLLRRMG